MKPQELRSLSQRIHTDNKKWWVDLHTELPIHRNEGEIIALVQSEIKEAFDGYSNGEMDDHLPDWPMEEVELADTIIRIMDFIGGTHIQDEICMMLEKLDGWNPFFVDDFLESKYLKIHGHCSDWLEAARKGRHDEKYMSIARLIISIEDFAYSRGFKLFHAVEDKLAYNRQRADHKIENRRAEGGKVF